MRCAHCGTRFDPSDNYCRHCGMVLNRSDLPTVVSHSLLPVPWSIARGPVVRGVLALAFGTAMELARREVARRVARRGAAGLLPLPVMAKPYNGRRFFPWLRRLPKGEYEVTETVIQRSVRFFRK